jgi:3-dehydroshikimate dehydratase
MIRLGLCSRACITRDIKGVIALASAAGLEAVEWAADVHIVAGDSRAAEEAMMATLMAGLTTASYATLYRAGAEDGDFTRFDALIKIASILQAPIMRLFAGGDEDAPSLAPELEKLGGRAAERGITLCVSMGRGTGLDSYKRAARLVAAVDHDFVRFAWEDLPGAPEEEASAALEGLGRYAGLVLAKSAGRDGKPRPIAEGESEWRRRIRAFKLAETDPKMGSFVLLGGARAEGAEGTETLARDAETLRALVAEVEPKRNR